MQKVGVRITYAIKKHSIFISYTNKIIIVNFKNFTGTYHNTYFDYFFSSIIYNRIVRSDKPILGDQIISETSSL